MAKAEVRCPVCGSSFQLGKGGNAVTELSDGIHYLVPETIRNENLSKDAKAYVRMEALKAAGVNVDKLQNLITANEELKTIFNDDDPILEEIGKGGFIRNPELFRRFICAQTFRLLKDSRGWTHAVRKMYDIKYVFNQSKRELCLLIKLQKKCPNDIRFQFFTLEDLRTIFAELFDYNKYRHYSNDTEIKLMKNRILNSDSYEDLLSVVNRYYWRFDWKCSFKPKAWLNCFKGAGAYYTLQNIIRTHGLVIPKCKDMNESLKFVDDVFKSIIAYEPKDRRWDILLSVLTMAVEKTKFELKY